MKMVSSKNREVFLKGIQAAAEGDLKTLSELIDSSLNTEDTDEHGRSLLHYAVRSGSIETVRFLVLSCQMDPTWADEDLVTPYDLAADGSEIEAFFHQYLGFGLHEAYRNPILRGFHADPSIVRVGEDYYMVHSSFLNFPCLPISHSRDLVHWTRIGYGVSDAEWAKEHLGNLQCGRGFWAPDISYENGRFYICATLRNNDDMPYRQTQIVTSSERPEGPYETPVIHNIPGIDPSIFTDDDGRRYMLVNRGARMMEISRDGRTILTKPRRIAYGWSGHAPEGPHLLKKDGFYYLFLAEGGTGIGHMITCLRSRSLWGPYENCPYNPIMTQRNPAAAIQCCGHGKPVDTPDGRWYMVYLCDRLIDGKWGMLGRETCLDEITWTEDGWPIVNKRRGPSSLARKPYPDHGSTTDGSQDGSGYDPHDRDWICIRTRDEKYVQQQDDGSVVITGSRYDISDLHCRSFALKYQTEMKFSYQLRMTDMKKECTSTAGAEAGLVLYYDDNSFIKFGIRSHDGMEVFAAEYSDDHYVRTTRKKTEQDPSGEMIFRVDTDKLTRTFFLNGRRIEQWDDVTGICSEGLHKGKRFTGAMIGAFVYGDGKYHFQEIR